MPNNLTIRERMEKGLAQMRKSLNSEQPYPKYILYFHPNDPRLKQLRELGYLRDDPAPAEAEEIE